MSRTISHSIDVANICVVQSRDKLDNGGLPNVDSDSLNAFPPASLDGSSVPLGEIEIHFRKPQPLKYCLIVTKYHAVLVGRDPGVFMGS